MAFEWLVGSGPKTQQMARFTPEQNQQRQNYLNMALGLLRNPTKLPPEISLNYGPIGREARVNFMTQTVPTLAERFTALGGSGTSQNSSAFQGALGQAGAGLERGLAADQARMGLQAQGLGLQRHQLGLQQQGQLLTLLQNLLSQSYNPTYENVIQQGRRGLLGTLLPAAGAVAGAYFGGLPGAALGHNLANQIQPQPTIPSFIPPSSQDYGYRLGGSPLPGLGGIAGAGAHSLYNSLGLGGF